MPGMIIEGPLDAVRRSEHLRGVAREAWAKLQSRERLLRSLRARNRGQGYIFRVGQQVWVHRKPLSGRAAAWYGPGTIASLTPTGAFVMMRGSLWKCNSASLKPQTSEDALADEMVRRYLAALRTDMSREGLRTQRRYVDCSREPPPAPEREGPPEEEEVRQAAGQVHEVPQEPVEGVESRHDTPAIAEEVAAGEENLIPIEVDGSRGPATRGPEDHPEQPPATRQRVERPFRGAETLARDPPQPASLPDSVLWISPVDEKICLATHQIEVQKGVVYPEQLPDHLRERRGTFEICTSTSVCP